MPEDIYGDYGSDAYGEPVGPLEAVYSAPAAAATEYPPLDLSGWDIEAFKALHNNPTGQANADAINKYIAEQAASGKSVVSLNPYQGSGLDAINANIWNAYNQFDPNDPTATTGQVFRFDTGAGYASAPAVLSKGKSYTLTDGKGQKVLGTASTPEEMQRLVDLADAQKYGWYLYETNPEGGFTPGTQLFGETDPRISGALGVIINYGLPIGVGLLTGGIGALPSLGAGTTAGLMGATGLVSGLAGGKTFGDALLQGAIAGGTAGLLKAPILSEGKTIGGAISNVLSDIPVVGDALKEVSKGLDLGGSSYNPLTNEIIVSGSSAAPLVSNVASGLLGSAAFTPNYSGLGQYASPDYADIKQPPAETVYEQTAPENVDPNAIVVTGNTTPLDMAGALDSAASSLLPQIVSNPVTEELAVKPAEKPAEAKPQEQPEATDQNEIVVTGGTTPLDLSNLTGSLASSFVPQVVTNPITNELAVKTAETPTQQEKVEDVFDETFAQPSDIVVTAGPDLGALNNLVSGGISALTPSVGAPSTPSAEGPLSQETTQETTQEEQPGNEIVVTGDTGLNLPPLPLPPITSVDIPDLAGTVLPDVPQGPLSQETTQEEQPGNEIVVEGDTGLNLPPLPLPPITSVDIPDLAGTVLPDVPQGPLSQEEVTQETTPTENEIVVEGDTGLNLPPLPLPPITSVDIPPLGGTELPDVPQGPLSQETAQEEEPTNEIVVEGNTPKPIEDLISSVGTVVPPLNTVDIPADAGNVTPKDDKGGLSTLDKLRLAAAALGALGGGAAGGGGGATLPAGLGRRDPIYSAKLPTPGQNGAFAVGGLGGSTLPMPAGGDLTQFGMGNATRAAPTQIPQYGGVNPPGFNTQTWDWLGPQQTVAKDIMDQLAVLPSSAAPVAEPVKKAMGGYAVGGPGDGRSDEIPALLSDGEYVIDAETVALLGNGSSKAGAQQLDKFRANIRKHKGRQLARGKFSVKAKQPSAYLSGGR